MAETVKGWDTSPNPEAFAAALASPAPRYYVNGFINSMSSTDVISILTTNGHPTAVLNFSYSTVKTLASALLELIENLERATKQPILGAGQIAQAMNPQLSSSGSQP